MPIAAVMALLCAPAPCDVLVNGAGATFPYPIYAKWFDEFQRLHPETQINYQPVGSGGGIRQLQAGIVDFAASDCPLSDAQLAASKMLHFPTVLGAVVPIYNVPGLEAELNFTPEALAGIFLGTVTRWNDRAIAAANPGIALPEARIVPVHRSDGSGTTFIWTDFLSKTNAGWKKRAGTGVSINWPCGLGARGNGGLAALVSQTPYSLGYVELAYALQTRIAAGRVRNAAGKFVRANVRSIKAAAERAAEQMPADFRISITNAAGEEAYPIASFTWLLTPAKAIDPAKKRAIVAFLRWMLSDGQRMAEPLGYAPLPPAVSAKGLAAIARIQ
jgi:phosphate transport system substrate-binding protein